jgi:hypothetical protein
LLFGHSGNALGTHGELCGNNLGTQGINLNIFCILYVIKCYKIIYIICLYFTKFYQYTILYSI